MNRMMGAALIGLLAALGAAAQSHAQEFRAVTVVVGFAPGGGDEEAGGAGGGALRQRSRPEPTYDQMALLLQHHLGKFLPGKPLVSVRNTPGAGSRAALAQLMRQAPRDGSTIAILGAAALRETALEQNAANDISRLGWIGGLSREIYACVARPETGVRSLEDARTTEAFFGAVDPRTRAFRHASALAMLMGAKARIITGYNDSEEIISNLPRKELDGLCGWPVASLRSRYADWLSDGKLRVLAQFGPERDPLFAYAPTGAEAAPAQSAVLGLLDQEGLYAWPLAAPPGLPTERLDTLRRAFAEMLRDPVALAEANGFGLAIAPVPGEDIAAAFEKLRDASPATVATLRRLSTLESSRR